MENIKNAISRGLFQSNYVADTIISPRLLEVNLMIVPPVIVMLARRDLGIKVKLQIYTAQSGHQKAN